MDGFTARLQRERPLRRPRRTSGQRFEPDAAVTDLCYGITVILGPQWPADCRLARRPTGVRPSPAWASDTSAGPGEPVVGPVLLALGVARHDHSASGEPEEVCLPRAAEGNRRAAVGDSRRGRGLSSMRCGNPAGSDPRSPVSPARCRCPGRRRSRGGARHAGGRGGARRRAGRRGGGVLPGAAAQPGDPRMITAVVSMTVGRRIPPPLDGTGYGGRAGWAQCSVRAENTPTVHRDARIGDVPGRREPSG